MPVAPGLVAHTRGEESAVADSCPGRQLVRGRHDYLDSFSSPGAIDPSSSVIWNVVQVIETVVRHEVVISLVFLAKMVSAFAEMVNVVAEMVCAFCNHVGAAIGTDGNASLNTEAHLNEVVAAAAWGWTPAVAPRTEGFSSYHIFAHSFGSDLFDQVSTFSDRSCDHRHDVYHNLEIAYEFYPVVISILKCFSSSSTFEGISAYLHFFRDKRFLHLPSFVYVVSRLLSLPGSLRLLFYEGGELSWVVDRFQSCRSDL